MECINCRGRLVSLQQPLVMGIINVNDESFYAGSRRSSVDEAVDTAGKMLAEGASIIDIGGQSTAPASRLVSEEEELKRVLPVIEGIAQAYPGAILSIDTFYSVVAGHAVDAGAAIVNDISAGSLDENMLSTVGKLQVPYIAMHMKGSPQTMQRLAHYQDIALEVLDYFIEKIDLCLRAGIKDIILDPGYGFAKTRSQNFELLNRSDIFAMLGKPVLTGISRKSLIHKTLGIPVEQSLNGTTVLNTVALQKGSRILRVHDVREAVEAVKLFNALCKAN